MTEEQYWFWLCNIKNMWQGKIKKLLTKFKNPKDIFHADEKHFWGLGISQNEINMIVHAQRFHRTREQMDKMHEKNIRFISLESKSYPEKLKVLEDKPYSLYIKGQLPDESIQNIAIIGARACTLNGKQTAKKLGENLARHGVNIISGMARGIDSFGHRGALAGGGNTFAILGCGVDICYPRENIELYEQISKQGGIISEYPLGTQPYPWQFPHRNRLISGFSDGVVLVEAKEKSGSLITIEYALNQGKDVFVVPGRMEDPLSQGCNRLIKSGAAILMDTEDILEELKISKCFNCEENVKNHKALEKELELVYSCLSLFPKEIHTLIEETGKSINELLGILIRLELMGLAEEPVKNHYIIRNVNRTPGTEREKNGEVSSNSGVTNKSKNN